MKEKVVKNGYIGKFLGYTTKDLPQNYCKGKFDFGFPCTSVSEMTEAQRKLLIAVSRKPPTKETSEKVAKRFSELLLEMSKPMKKITPGEAIKILYKVSQKSGYIFYFENCSIEIKGKKIFISGLK